MRDGLTEKLATKVRKADMKGFLREFQAKIVALAGSEAGMEYDLDREHVTLGRGPGVDLAFNDAAMSRQHAVIDFVDEHFRVRDLGSTNGLRVNGNRVQASDLKPGDHIEVGGLVFQLVVDPRDTAPDVYELPSE